jgi:hypothetical protein
MTPDQIATMAAALQSEDGLMRTGKKQQEAAFEWVDAAMRRAVGLVRELTVTQLAATGEGAIGTPLIDVAEQWNRARMVDTYVSAAIEVASQGIAVVVEEGPAEPEDEGLSIRGCRISLPSTGRLSKSLVVSVDQDARLISNDVGKLAQEAERAGRTTLDIVWSTPEGDVAEVWSVGHALCEPEAVLCELATIFRRRALPLPPALQPYDPGEPEPKPYADHACGHACDPKMVAAGEDVCSRCRVNPSLR